MRITQEVGMRENDRSLQFKIKEMSALNLESWLIRAGRLLGREKNKEDPFFAAGVMFEEGPLRLYLRDTAENNGKLMEEILACCSVVDESGWPTQLSRNNIDNFIEDMATLVNLRQEALILNLRFYPDGAREHLELPREWSFRKALEAVTFARPANVPGITGSILSQGMTSLREMQDYYSFMDALDMLEVLNVRNYNQWAAREAARHGR